MSLAHENLRALKKSHRFIIEECLWKTRFQWLKLIISRKRFNEFKKEAYYAIKHFPFDCELDRLYSPYVCHECGESKQFCRCK